VSKNNQIINSFVAGEVSEKFWGRTDTQQYNQSCEELLNVIVSPQGGAGTRPGTRSIGEITRANGAIMNAGVTIIPFCGVDGSRWIIKLSSIAPDEPVTPYAAQPLEWTATRADNLATAPTNVGLATLAGAAAIYSGYYSSFNQSNVHYAQAGNTLILTNGKQRPLRIVYFPEAADRKFIVRPYPDVGEWNTSALTAVTIPAADLQTWRQTPYLPVVTFSTKSINLAKGTDTLYTLTPGGGSTITFSPAWVGKMIKFTRAGATQVTVILVTSYTSTTVLRGIPIGGTNIANSTNYTYGGATGDQYYEECAWSEERGWPATCCFFEGRAVMGGQPAPIGTSLGAPDEIWFSQVDDIFEFDYRGIVTDVGYSDPLVTSDAFSTTLRSNILNTVKWLSPKKSITVGTDFEEFIVKGPAATKTIGIDNIQTSGETATGSAPVMAARIEAGTIFLDRTSRKLRELAYNFDEDSLKCSDLSILAPHMGTKTQLSGTRPDSNSVIAVALGYVNESFFTQIARQALPLGIVWTVDTYGCMAAVTREREQNVTAWHYHQIAGTVNGVAPKVISICALPAGAGTDTPNYVLRSQGDELWMAVQRRVGKNVAGSIVYEDRVFLERMERDWEGPTYGWQWLGGPTKDGNARAGNMGGAPIYMDGTVVYNSKFANGTNNYVSGIIPLSDLPHGAGAVVDVIVNGIFLGKKTITVNGLDLSADLTDLGVIGGLGYWIAMVGFAYTSRIVPLTPEAPAQTGSSRGIPRRVHEIVIEFSRTVAAKVGRRSDQDEENTPVDPLEELVFKPGVNQNDPIPLYSGEHRVTMPQGYETLPRIVIQNDLPFPMTVSAIVAKMVAYE
jgi:hypothetical protein